MAGLYENTLRLLPRKQNRNSQAGPNPTESAVPASGIPVLRRASSVEFHPVVSSKLLTLFAFLYFTRLLSEWKNSPLSTAPYSCALDRFSFFPLYRFCCGKLGRLSNGMSYQSEAFAIVKLLAIVRITSASVSVYMLEIRFSSIQTSSTAQHGL